MAVLGNETGVFAPGIKNRKTAAQVSHHLLLSHGLAVQALRAQGCRAALGMVLNLSPMFPATDSAADQAKTRLEDGRLVRWYMDPLFKGSYPQDVLDDLGDDAPDIQPGDLQPFRRPWTFWASTTTRARSSAPASPGMSRPAAWRSPTWTGRSTRKA